MFLNRRCIGLEEVVISLLLVKNICSYVIFGYLTLLLDDSDRSKFSALLDIGCTAFNNDTKILYLLDNF